MAPSSAPPAGRHRPLRVLHCPTNTGAHPAGLAAAERRLGLRSHCVSFQPSPFGFPCDEVLAPPGTSPFRFELRRWQLLWRALREFDVVHFNFGRSILPSPASLATLERRQVPRAVRAAYGLYAGLLEHRDLALLRRAGKVIAVTFQGDDARQGAFCREAFAIEPSRESGYHDREADAAARRTVSRFADRADLIYALNPDLLHVLPARARFQPYAHLEPDAWKPVGPSPGDRPPLVMHAPTHRGVKGTRFLLEAVEALRREGLRFRFRLVEGVSHDEARALYQQADLLVDQLLVGWYGGLAVELMALAKPVIAYLRPEDLAFVPPELARELPVIRAEPATIRDVLRAWIRAEPARREAQGAASRRFVARWHDPTRIAAEHARDYAGALARRRRPGVAPVTPSSPPR